METTNTEIIMRMVEAGLGVSIVPLLGPNGIRHARTDASLVCRLLRDEIQPIHSGILNAPADKNAAGRRPQFVEFVHAEWQK